MILLQGCRPQRHGAAVAEDAATLAQHGAVGLVGADRGSLDVHRAVEDIDPAAQGRRAVGLVGVDRVVGQRQAAVLAVDPSAQGGARGVDLVGVDGGIGDRRGAAGRADAAPWDVAWLLLMLLEATFSVPGLKMPPPATAELPLTVQLVSVVVPPVPLFRPPPFPDGGVAADGAVGQRGVARPDP